MSLSGAAGEAGVSPRNVVVGMESEEVLDNAGQQLQHQPLTNITPL